MANNLVKLTLGTTKEDKMSDSCFVRAVQFCFLDEMLGVGEFV